MLPGNTDHTCIDLTRILGAGLPAGSPSANNGEAAIHLFVTQCCLPGQYINECILQMRTPAAYGCVSDAAKTRDVSLVVTSESPTADPCYTWACEAKFN